MGRSSVVTRFDGITIRMFPLDHFPPHFHAEYVGRRMTLTVLDMRQFIQQAPALNELKESALFETVHVVGGAVEWDTGAALDPDVCYWEILPTIDYFSAKGQELTGVN